MLTIMSNSGVVCDNVDPSMWLQFDAFSGIFNRGIRDLYPIRLELLIGMYASTIFDCWKNRAMRPIIEDFFDKPEKFSFFRQKRGGDKSVESGNINCLL